MRRLCYTNPRFNSSGPSPLLDYLPCPWRSHYPKTSHRLYMNHSKAPITLLSELAGSANILSFVSGSSSLRRRSSTSNSNSCPMALVKYRVSRKYAFIPISVLLFWYSFAYTLARPLPPVQPGRVDGYEKSRRSRSGTSYLLEKLLFLRGARKAHFYINFFLCEKLHLTESKLLFVYRVFFPGIH